MKYLSFLASLLIWAVILTVAWLLGVQHVMSHSIEAGHLLDWIMGALCMLWLLVILKVPWDLYFQANEVMFELQRSAERNISVTAGRAEYVRSLRRRLAVLAVGAHLGSAALVAAVAYFSGGVVGYWFAVFYLVSTVFRPALAGYRYLSQKLLSIGQEVRYPREDVVAMRATMEAQERTLRELGQQTKVCGDALRLETTQRESDTRELRQTVKAITREFETTISKLSDNQEVINGIQAFVRLIAHSTQS